MGLAGSRPGQIESGRAARGLEPLANADALDDSEAPDAVLDEAVEIAADVVQLPKAQEPARFS
jgi:hypothetical protein